MNVVELFESIEAGLTWVFLTLPWWLTIPATVLGGAAIALGYVELFAAVVGQPGNVHLWRQSYRRRKLAAHRLVYQRADHAARDEMTKRAYRRWKEQNPEPEWMGW